uniref:PX domain-containing protein n=1 Tax=Eptatretus burgeri TaxID=7764 RepID=A0A8C4NGX7_EPTBU
MHGALSAAPYCPEQLVFSVTENRVVVQSGRRYVLYTIALLRTGECAETYVPVERRFSQLVSLHKTLRRRFPDLPVSLPSRLCLSVLTSTRREQRGQEIEAYLERLAALPSVRCAREFQDFFYHPELVRAHECIRGGAYKEAATILSPTLCLQRRLSWDWLDLQRGALTLAAISVCQFDLGNQHAALRACLEAIDLLEPEGCNSTTVDTPPLLLPLTDMARRLSVILGNGDTSFANSLLKRLKGHQVKPGHVPSLKEYIVTQYLE